MADTFIAGEVVVKWTADLKAVKKSVKDVKKISDAAGTDAGKKFQRSFTREVKASSVGKNFSKDIKKSVNAKKLGTDIGKDFTNNFNANSKLTADIKVTKGKDLSGGLIEIAEDMSAEVASHAERINKAVAEISLTAAIKDVTELADVWTAAGNKIRAAEQQFGGALASTDQVADMATDSRTELTAMVDLYTILAGAAGGLSITQAELANVSELTAKAFKSAGLSAQEQQSAIKSFSSSLSDGIISDKDLKNLADTAPLIFEGLQNSLSLTESQLQSFAANGLLSVEEVFGAILDQSKAIEDQFSKTTPTFEESLSALRTVGTQIAGSLDDSLAASEIFSKIVGFIANNIKLLEVAAHAFIALLGAKLVVNIGKAIPMLRALGLAFHAALGPIGLLTGAIAAVIGGLLYLRNRIMAAKQADEDWENQQEKHNEVRRRTNALLTDSAELSERSGDEASKASDGVSELSDSYENLEDRLKKIADATRQAQIEREKLTLSEQQARLAEVKNRADNLFSESGFSYSEGEQAEIDEIQAQVEETEGKIAALKNANDDNFNQDERKKFELSQQSAELRQQMRIARAANDQAKIRELNDQKLLIELIEENLQNKTASDYAGVVANAQKQFDEIKKAEADRAKVSPIVPSQTAAATPINVDTADQILEKQLADQRLEYERAINQSLVSRSDQMEILEGQQESQVALATKSAAIEVQKIDNSETIDGLANEINLRVEKNDQLLAELQSELELAKLRADSSEIADLEKQIDLLRRKREYLKSGQLDLNATKNAQDDIDEINSAKNIGKVRDLFKGGIKSAIDGDFEDFLAGKLQGAADSMFDNAVDTLLDSLLGAGGPLEGIIGGLFGGGEGGGDLLGGIFGGLFGGKSGGTDDATDALGSFTEGLSAAEGGLGGFAGGLASIFGGEGGGGIIGILGGLFAGFFADGGVVPRGQFAIVGEQGPEIISAGSSPLRVTPMNDNYAARATAGLIPDGGGARSMAYAPVNNFYGHTQDDLERSLDERDRALKSEMPGMMDRHSFNQRRGMA